MENIHNGDVMKIEFEDGSFLEAIKEEDGIMLVMCGFKSKAQLTMSSSKLNKEQINKLVEFLSGLGV
jgi:hypothetical protein